MLSQNLAKKHAEERRLLIAGIIDLQKELEKKHLEEIEAERVAVYDAHIDLINNLPNLEYATLEKHIKLLKKIENPAPEVKTDKIGTPYDKNGKNLVELIYENNNFSHLQKAALLTLLTKTYLKFLYHFVEKLDNQAYYPLVEIFVRIRIKQFFEDSQKEHLLALLTTYFNITPNDDTKIICFFNIRNQSKNPRIQLTPAVGEVAALFFQNLTTHEGVLKFQNLLNNYFREEEVFGMFDTMAKARLLTLKPTTSAFMEKSIQQSLKKSHSFLHFMSRKNSSYDIYRKKNNPAFFSETEKKIAKLNKKIESKILDLKEYQETIKRIEQRYKQ